MKNTLRSVFALVIIVTGLFEGPSFAVGPPTEASALMGKSRLDRDEGGKLHTIFGPYAVLEDAPDGPSYFGFADAMFFTSETGLQARLDATCRLLGHASFLRKGRLELVRMMGPGIPICVSADGQVVHSCSTGQGEGDLAVSVIQCLAY